MSKVVEVNEFVATGVEDYKDITPKQYNDLIHKSQFLQGTSVIHINATSKGGGVAELLRSQIPFERSLGLDSRWLTFTAPDDFFVITKKIHNMSQGKEGELTEAEQKRYLENNESIGKALNEYLKQVHTGIVVVHDPQPLGVKQFIPEHFYTIFRFHTDISTPNPWLMNFFKPFLLPYDQLVVSSNEYIASLPGVNPDLVHVILPAIDGFTKKNIPMERAKAFEILAPFGIDESRPLISQVSRFDPWKDPIGVIEAYRIAKKDIPYLQLLLPGFLVAKDDPEGAEMVEKVRAAAGDDPDIHILTDINVLGSVSFDDFISAVYTASDIMIQNSYREGFGLTMTEAMWKEKPLIAAISQGALLQIQNDYNGILVQSVDALAQAIILLHTHKPLAKKIGRHAKKSVINNFLISRYINDHIQLYLLHKN